MGIYKKMISLNPDKYKEISQVEAYQQYIMYLRIYIEQIETRDLDPQDYKDFPEWLETEI